MSEYRITPNDIAAKLAVTGYSASYGDIEKIGGNTYIYCYSAAAQTEGNVVQLGVSGGTSGKNPVVTTPATTAVGVRHGVVANTTTAAGGVWVQIGPGHAEMLVNGTTDIADGNALQGVNGALYAVKDGGSTATADTFAYAEEAYTTDGSGTITVWLLPDKYATIG